MMFNPVPTDLLTSLEMARADRLALAHAGLTGLDLMRRASLAVAEAASDVFEDEAPRRILVLCGPGNNGGDGYGAAIALRDRGHDVCLAAMARPQEMRGEAAATASLWSGPIVDASAAEFGEADLVIDALFGAGLNRALDGDAEALVRRLNRSDRPVLSVDVPSGLDADTGQALGAVVAARRTVTFFRLKPGHLLQPGHAHCGRVVLADIGIPDQVLAAIEPTHHLNAPGLWRAHYPVPSPQGHKYSRGHALVVSGAMPTIGAARLASRAALRIGAGLVTVASPLDAMAAHAAQLTAIMLRPFDGCAGLLELLADSRRNAVVIGPGLGVGEATRDLVEAALRPPPDGKPRALVLDADGLTSFAGDADRLGSLIAAAGPVVVTPHDGEFARLFADAGPAFEDRSKVVRARAGAARLGAVLVLKGADTVVADPGGRVAIAAADSPWLATAGSGDVLGGFVGGLLAQGMKAFEAACAAVYLHAACGRRFGPGLISEDLPETLPAVLGDLLADPPHLTSNQPRNP